MERDRKSERNQQMVDQLDELTRLVERRNYELYINPEEDFIRKAGIDSF